MKVRSFLVPTLFLLVSSGCGGPAETGPETAAGSAAAAEALPEGDGTRDNPYVGRGVIQEIDDGTLVIEHGNIPGMMPPMTMSFPVSEEVAIDELAVGDEVEFSIEMLEPQGYHVFRVEHMNGE